MSTQSIQRSGSMLIMGVSFLAGAILTDDRPPSACRQVIATRAC